MSKKEGKGKIEESGPSGSQVSPPISPSLGALRDAAKKIMHLAPSFRPGTKPATGAASPPPTTKLLPPPTVAAPSSAHGTTFAVSGPLQSGTPRRGKDAVTELSPPAAPVTARSSPQAIFRRLTSSPAPKRAAVHDHSTVVAIPGPSHVDDGAVVPPSSSDVLRPLLSGTRRRHSSSLISRIRKSIAVEKKKSVDIDMAEFARQDMRIDMDTTDEVDSTRHLLSSIRSLPNPMSEKRQYRDDLLKASLVPDYEFFHLPIEAFYKRLKKKVPEIVKDIQDNYNVWSSSFKVIEGRFGTGVVSYFVFLRWLLLLNALTFVIMFVFLVLPQVIGTKIAKTNVTIAPEKDVFDSDLFDRLPQVEPPDWNDARHSRLPVDHLGSLLDAYAVDGFLDAALHHTYRNLSGKTRVQRSDYCLAVYVDHLSNRSKSGVTARIEDFFEGSGWMEYTIMFAGYYEHAVTVFNDQRYYDISVAFLVVLLLLVVVNIVLMMSYASEGVQESMLEKLQEMYCYVVFCGWDFCIEEEKTARQQQNSIFQEIISMLAEGRRRAKRKEWTPSYRAKIYGIRVAAHVATILILVMAYYLIYYVASVQLHAERRHLKGVLALILQFLPPLTITGLNFLFPLLLAIIIPFEEYKIEKQINHMLMRIVLLREASIIILVSSFYYQITCEPQDFCGKGYESCPSPRCWETYVGKQMYRLSIMDLFVHIAVTFAWETPRMYAIRRWKNKFTNMLGLPLFDIPTQVLGLVYSQTLSWLGMFYCPLLPAVSVLKVIIFFYVKKFTVLKNCVPAETAYKASRSNAIFVIVLMLSYFITIGILGYSVTQIEPSPGCSPFRYYNHMVHALSEAIEERSPEINRIIAFMFSPLFAFPIIVLLCLSLYYYITKTWAHKKMVQLLKVQLTMEGKDKQFLLQRVTKIRPQTTPSAIRRTPASLKPVLAKKPT